MQSAFHVAVIMDGNGRWATQRGRPRTAGHRAGAEAVRRVVRAAPGLGVDVLTLYAFSADNWQRPITEVTALLRLFERYLRRETAVLVEDGVRLSIIGRRDRLPAGLRAAIAGPATPWSWRPCAPGARAAPSTATVSPGSLGRRCTPTDPRAMWTCWCAPAASSASPTSCCGSAPTPN